MFKWRVESPVIYRREIFGGRSGGGLKSLDHELIAIRGGVNDPGKVAACDLFDLCQLLVDGGSVVESCRCSVLLGDLNMLLT